MKKIAINGLGRIGRSILRAYLEGNYPNIEIVAANGPASIEAHAHFIKYDSVHGTIKDDIFIEDNHLLIADKKIRILSERDPAKLPWRELNVDIVLECTGKFTKAALASSHISSGAKKVIISSPCEDADATIVYKVNDDILNNDHKIISIGSCTTNALAPIVKVLNDNFGIESGFMTTIHAYTNDQNILDNNHKDPRRARAAAMSMIPTSTGAAKTIGIVLPELAGKLGGTAIRVPTPNVSMIDLALNLTKSTSKDEINEVMLKASTTQMQGVLGIAPAELVSIDFNHSPFSTIFDPFETKVITSKFCRVVSWYDNEWGFSNRMLDIANII